MSVQCGPTHYFACLCREEKIAQLVLAAKKATDPFTEANDHESALEELEEALEYFKKVK